MCEERFHALANGDLKQPVGVHWQITEFELSTIKDCIEHADGMEKDLMQQIIRVYQVLISRWDEIEVVNLWGSEFVQTDAPEFINRYEQFHGIRDWVALKSICDALFNYARGAVSEPSRDKMRQSIFSVLQHLGSGGRRGKGGWLLINNKNYSDYVNRLIEKDHVRFIDGSWR